MAVAYQSILVLSCISICFSAPRGNPYCQGDGSLEPECDGVTSYFPHAFNCGKFWQCGPDLQPCLFECPPISEDIGGGHLYFSVELLTCDWPENVDCSVGTTEVQTTEEQTQEVQTTKQQTTRAQTTKQQTTGDVTTEDRTTKEQTTEEQTTEEQTTEAETTKQQTTGDVTTDEQTTEEQTTEDQTTDEQTTEEQTTEAQTTKQQTTGDVITEDQTTEEQTTEEQTTEEQQTEEQTTEAQTTETTDTTLFATCDNLMKVYFDGVLQFEDEGWPGTDMLQWKRTTELIIPSGTKVVGIECKDLGSAEGILASTSDGVVTDGSWLCSNNENLAGWAEPGFADTNRDFYAASNVGGYTNGGGPWGLRPGIADSAQWIWADQAYAWTACKKILG